MFTKTCESCGVTFLSKASRTRFCSRACGDDWRRGRPNPKNAGPARPPVERFWEKVNKQSENECWVWRGAREVAGYGKFYLDGGKGTGRPQLMQKAHRASWELHNGPIPAGLFVLHHCDNPPCVNPAHLYIGTNADNARDRERRGRGNQPRGENSRVAKITDAQVAEIRQRVAAGESQIAVGRDYGIKQPQVSRIVLGTSRRKPANSDVWSE